MPDPAALLGVLAVSGALAWSLWRDPRPLRNGALAVLAAYCLLGLVASAASQAGPLETPIDVVALGVGAVVVLGLLLLPLLLVADGVLVLHRERRSLGNALSLLAGLAMLALPVVLVLLLRHEDPVTGTLAVGLVTAQACAGLLFLVFAVQTALYARTVRHAPANAVIVLGAGLVGGQVSPLLTTRLRRAVAAAGERVGAIPVVASGGQGRDEPYPEGRAMADWLREQGMPDGRVLVEDRSRNTRENLRYSAELLAARGVPGPYLIVTNDYHAPRAAMLARRLGVDAQAIGAPTARWYWPSAYLREFVAVLVDHRSLVVLSGLVVAGLMLATWLSLTAA